MKKITRDGSVGFGRVLLQADVGKGVLAEDGLGVEVGCHEPTLPAQGLVGGKALHVRGLEEVLQVLVQVGQRGVDRHLVLPLELGPHLAELDLGADGGHDVVHDVDVDVVQDDDVAIGRGAAAIVHDVAEDDPVLRRGDLDVGLDRAKVQRAHDDWLRLLDELEVTEGSQFQCHILKGVACL